MKVVIGLVVVVLIVAGIYLLGSDFSLKDKGALPTVDVEVNAESGKLPDIDHKGPQIEVNSKDVGVTVPKVDVYTEEEKIKLPTVDFKAAEGSTIDDANKTESQEKE